MVWLCVPRGCDGSSRRASQYLMGSWLGFPSYCSSSSKQAVFPWLQTWASTSLCWAILHKRNVKASLILQQGEAVSQLSSHWSPGAHSLSPSLSDYKSTSARWPPHFVSPSGYILSFSKTLALWMGLVMAVPGSYSSLTARNGNRAPHPCLTPSAAAVHMPCQFLKGREWWADAEASRNDQFGPQWEHSQETEVLTLAWCLPESLLYRV